MRKMHLLLIILLLGGLIAVSCGDGDDDTAPELDSAHPGWGSNTCFGTGCHETGDPDFPHGTTYSETDCQDCHGRNGYQDPTSAEMSGQIHRGPQNASQFVAGATVTAVNILNPALRYSSSPSTANGSFTIAAVPPGSYDFEISDNSVFVASYNFNMPALSVSAGDNIHCSTCHTPSGQAMGYLFLAVGR